MHTQCDMVIRNVRIEVKKVVCVFNMPRENFLKDVIPYFSNERSLELIYLYCGEKGKVDF